MPYYPQRDLRGKHPIDTSPFLFQVDGTGSLFDGTGSQVITANLTSSNAVSSSYSVSASYEILYESSSSFADWAASSSVSISSSFASASISSSYSTTSSFAVTSSWAALNNAHATLTQASPTVLDFTQENYRTVTLTGDITFSTAGKSAVKILTVRIICTAPPRNFTFPVGWVFVGGTAPVSIGPNKTAILTLICYGTADSDIVATYAVEP